VTGALLAFAPAHQHYLLEARQMQALSFTMHIPLVCFAIAFPVMVLFVEARYLRTGDELYRALARRWSKVMAALFAIGVVTGTILSFEMGLLWPNFMATFGSVFGVAFAIEGFAFFTEAIFIAIYIYGWGRMSPRMHFLTGIPVAIASLVGSLMVISVNAWMNHPGGFRISSGKVVDVHPWSALFGNSYLWHELVHMYVAGYVVAGFVLAGVYAFRRLRGHWGRYERTALVVPLTVAVLAAPVQVLVGDWAGRDVAAAQPVKLAAMDGATTTRRGAAEHVFGWYTNGRLEDSIAIPQLLSVLAYHDSNAEVRGLDSVPPADRPPVNVTHWAFQLMVGIGLLLAGLGLVHVVTAARRRRLPDSRWFYRGLVAAAPLSVVALVAGWVTTEVGRQPWVAYGVMRTSAAVTGAGGIPVGYATLALVYLGLLAAILFILRRLAAAPLVGV
jgi:cytochrome bd ubiquinol oxidase subunit I